MNKQGKEGKRLDDAQDWDAIEGSDKLSESVVGKLNRTGRKKGVQNKLTRTVKQVLEKAFNELQKHPQANLVTWATANPGAFYQIAAKLIPIESKTELTIPIEHEMSP